MGKTSEKIDPSTFQETIKEVNAADYATECELIFGSNKNLYRYFQSLFDGLKPVERRFLYTMYDNKRFHGNFLKLARASTSTVEYHPHGFTSISDVAVGMSQDWMNNICLTDVPGNNGDIRGERAAADRYLDIQLSDFAYECYFEDFEISNVDMTVSYLGESMEPEFLPAKYPVGIINGGFSSIGYVYASNVPQYNFKEVCETMIALIKDPKAKVLIYPDIPTGADVIMAKKEAKEIFETGHGKVMMRGTADIDYIHNIITFTSIPIQTNTRQIIDKLVSLRMSGKFDEIADIKDKTTEQDGLILEIELKNDVQPEAALEKLYQSKTHLKKTNPCSIIMVDNYQSKEYSIRSYLLRWLEYRRECVRACFNNRIAKLMEQQHINDVRMFVLGGDNMERTLQISKSSKDEEEYIQKLMKSYKITSLQAQSIANLKTSAFTKATRDSFKETGKKLKEKIEEVQKVLKDPNGIDKEIIKQLEEGIKKYGRPRRSRIINDENGIVDDDMIVGISSDGYVKKIKRGGVTMGHISKNTGVMNMAIPVRESDMLLLFDTAGRVHVLPVSSLPSSTDKKGGLKLDRFVSLNGEMVVSATIAPKSADNAKWNYVMITEKGLAKKINVSALLKNSKLSKGTILNGIIINEGDKLSSVLTTDKDNEDIIIFTDRGDGMRISSSEIPQQLAASKGVKIITLRGKEIVLGMNTINDGDKYLIFATSTGKVKKTDIEYFPQMKRKDEPLALINLDDNDYLVTVKSARNENSAVFFKKNSESESVEVSDIPLKTRAAKADKLLKVTRGDSVLSMVIK